MANHVGSSGATNCDNEYCNVDNSGCSTGYITPNGTRHWIPNVANEYKPVVGRVYATFQDVLSMYESYAEKAGFDPRLATVRTYKGFVTHRYILCNKAGKPRNDSINRLDFTSPELKTRSSNFKVTNCGACIRVKAIKGTDRFELYCFIEQHNHALVGVENMELSRKRRQLLFSDQELIHKFQMSGIGPIKAHRLHSTMKGGQHLIRGTKADYKNFSRDMRCYIGDKDAQMLVNRMKNQATNKDNFSFKYVVENGELRSLFWVDDISKCN